MRFRHITLAAIALLAACSHDPNMISFDRDSNRVEGKAGSIWSDAELRGIVANAKMMFDGTIMPAFYVDAGYTRPLKKFEGKSILSAQQVEDVVAYLMTLKEE